MSPKLARPAEETNAKVPTDEEAFEAWKKLERYRASLVSPVREHGDEIVTVDDWKDLGFRSRRSFEDNLREKIPSFRAGAKRCAFKRDVVAFFVSHKVVHAPVIVDADETVEEQYLALVSGGE